MFAEAFEKTSGEMMTSALKAGGKLWRGAKAVGGRLAQGVSESGGSTVSNALKLQGLKHISDAITTAGGVGKSLSTAKGRGTLATGVGKAAPSLAALGAYGVGAKKIYDATLGGSGQKQPEYY